VLPFVSLIVAPRSRSAEALSFMSRGKKFLHQEVFSVTNLIYPWFLGHVLVQDHPYFAVTDANGRFEIKNLPTGTWRFRVWHERSGYIQQVERNGIKENWERGHFEITISEGNNNIQNVDLPRKQFERVWSVNQALSRD